MTNVLQTDAREVTDLLSLQFLLTLVMLAALPLVWLCAGGPTDVVRRQSWRNC